MSENDGSTHVLINKKSNSNTKVTIYITSLNSSYELQLQKMMCLLIVVLSVNMKVRQCKMRQLNTSS